MVETTTTFGGSAKTFTSTTTTTKKSSGAKATSAERSHFAGSGGGSTITRETDVGGSKIIGVNPSGPSQSELQAQAEVRRVAEQAAVKLAAERKRLEDESRKRQLVSKLETAVNRGTLIPASELRELGINAGQVNRNTVNRLKKEVSTESGSPTSFQKKVQSFNTKTRLFNRAEQQRTPTPSQRINEIRGQTSRAPAQEIMVVENPFRPARPTTFLQPENIRQRFRKSAVETQALYQRSGFPEPVAKFAGGVIGGTEATFGTAAGFTGAGFSQILEESLVATGQPRTKSVDIFGNKVSAQTFGDVFGLAAIFAIPGTKIPRGTKTSTQIIAKAPKPLPKINLAGPLEQRAFFEAVGKSGIKEPVRNIDFVKRPLTRGEKSVLLSRQMLERARKPFEKSDAYLDRLLETAKKRQSGFQPMKNFPSLGEKGAVNPFRTTARTTQVFKQPEVLIVPGPRKIAIPTKDFFRSQSARLDEILARGRLRERLAPRFRGTSIFPREALVPGEALVPRTALGSRSQFTQFAFEEPLLKVLQRTHTTTFTRPLTTSLTTTRARETEALQELTRTTTRAITKTGSLLRFRERLPHPRVPVGVPPPGIPFPGLLPGKTFGAPSRRVRAFDAFVKNDATKGARFVKVTDEPLPYGAARERAFIVSDNTISQTVMLKRKGFASRGPVVLQDRGYKFRQKIRKGKPEKNPLRFVERRNYAIDTVGEKEKLKVSAYLAREKKAKQQTMGLFKPNKRKKKSSSKRGLFSI